MIYSVLAYFFWLVYGIKRPSAREGIIMSYTVLAALIVILLLYMNV